MQEGPDRATSMGRVTFTSFIGTAIEFYDFYIYGTALAFAGVFFPPSGRAAAGNLAQIGVFISFAVAFCGAMAAFAALYGPVGAYLPELFGTRLRYSGASISYNFGGAFAPIIASALLALAGGSWAISAYIFLMALLSFTCLLFLSETYLTDFSGVRSEERRLLSEDGGVAE